MKKMSDLLYSTDYGKYYLGKCEETIKELGLKNKVQLILTSPPFPLNNKKQYGNLNGEEFLKWFTSLAELFSSVLTPNGSIVIEMGNAWEDIEYLYLYQEAQKIKRQKCVKRRCPVLHVMR